LIDEEKAAVHDGQLITTLSGQFRCVPALFWEGKNAHVQPQFNSQKNTVGKFVSLTKLKKKGTE